MGYRFLWRASAFVAALALSAAIGAVLMAAEVDETLSLTTAWITFFVAGAVIVRLEQRREQRH
jgi:hypothetical protein